MTMSSFNPSKLSTTLIPPATSSYPVSGRKYTLTHSDTTGQLFLSIGCSYNNKEIDKNMRDEVIAALHVTDRQAVIQGEVFVSGGEFSREQAQLRQPRREASCPGPGDGDEEARIRHGANHWRDEGRGV